MFFDLIKHRIAFDYLLGVFVCVFKKDGWKDNLHIIDQDMIKDKRSWSNFENTCFHIKSFVKLLKILNHIFALLLKCKFIWYQRMERYISFS